jgi:hypothetical protein
MAVNSFALMVPAAPGVGDALVCTDYTEKWVEVVNAGGATVNVECSFDTATWHIVSTVAVTSIVQVAIPARYVRVNLTALPAAAPTATLHGKLDAGQGGAD